MLLCVKGSVHTGRGAPYHAKNGTHNSKQHQRICTQIRPQIWFRVLCELGFYLHKSCVFAQAMQDCSFTVMLIWIRRKQKWPAIFKEFSASRIGRRFLSSEEEENE